MALKIVTKGSRPDADTQNLIVCDNCGAGIGANALTADMTLFTETHSSCAAPKNNNLAFLASDATYTP